MAKGEEIPKTNPAEIEKLIEQIRGTNLEPGSKEKQEAYGEVTHTDDTWVRILSCLKEDKEEKGLAMNAVRPFSLRLFQSPRIEFENAADERR